LKATNNSGILFSRIKDLEFYPIHNEASIFHLSGKDYQGQVIENDPKRIRLHRDQQQLMNTYKELAHWAVFGWHSEYKDFVNKHFTKEDVRDLINKYGTSILKKYFTDKESFEQEYEMKL